MKSLKTIIPELKNKKDPEEMGILMKTIKAVHQVSTNPTAVTTEELSRQRSEIERFSKLITPSSAIIDVPFHVQSIPCEWISPDFSHRKDKIILYCHGGGYTCGGLGYARILAAKMAVHTGLEVVSFEYRLAPENPYPAQLEDAISIWDYLMLKGYGASDIVLAGDSAGGNLALELCLKLFHDERKLPCALILMSPWTDMRAVNPSYTEYKDKDPLLTYEYILSVRGAYAGFHADFSAPELSPLLAKLNMLPPTLIQAGSNEILRDDSEKLAKKLAKSGVRTKLEIYTGCWHVFQQMPVHKATHALDSMSEFLDNIL